MPGRGIVTKVITDLYVLVDGYLLRGCQSVIRVVGWTVPLTNIIILIYCVYFCIHGGHLLSITPVLFQILMWSNSDGLLLTSFLTCTFSFFVFWYISGCQNSIGGIWS